MKTQISRLSFDRDKRYSGVYQQQGRMLTDADWNELGDIVKDRLASVLADVVGRSGVPRKHGIFPPDLSPRLQSGNVYVDGINGYVELGLTVEPGAEHTFHLLLKAPTVQADYEPRFRMARNGQGFGQRTPDNPILVSSAAVDDDARVVSGPAIPDVMRPGSQLTGVTVVVRNEGTTTWTHADGYKLGSLGDDAGDAYAFREGAGGDPYRVWLPNGVSVPPGGEHTFTFDLQAPAAGHRLPQFQMIREGVGWFGQRTLARLVSVIDETQPAPEPALDDALIVLGPTLPRVMTPGQTMAVQIVVRNTGRTVWTADAYRLVADGPHALAFLDGAAASGAPLEDEELLIKAQRAFPLAPPVPLLGTYRLYADVWERTVTWLEDESLRDPALHGADTCTRTQTMAQLKWHPNDFDADLDRVRPMHGTTRLRAYRLDRTAHPEDPCAPQSRRLGPTGNRLFRLEVHDVIRTAAAEDTVMLKWSCENAAEQHRLETPGTLDRSELPDGFVAKDWIYELFDSISETHLGVHLLSNWRPRRAALVAYDSGGQQELVYPSVKGIPWTFVRRWSGYVVLTLDRDAGTLSVVKAWHAGQPLPEVSISGSLQVGSATPELRIELGDLELGLVLTLEQSADDAPLTRFVPGDHWMAVLRPGAEGRLVTMLPESAAGTERHGLPLGIVHHYARVGTVKNGKILPFANDDPERARLSFPALTELWADRVQNEEIHDRGPYDDGVFGPDHISPTDVQETLEDLYATKVNRSGDKIEGDLDLEGDLRAENIYVENNIVAGGNGQDGDLVLKDRDGHPIIIASGDEARIRILDTDGNIVMAINGKGDVIAGGGGKDGDVVLKDRGGHDIVRIGADESRLVIRDEAGNERVAIEGAGTPGTAREAGAVMLKDAAGRTVVSLNERGLGNIVAGGHGQDGDIILKDGQGDAIVVISADEGRLRILDPGGGELIAINKRGHVVAGGHGTTGRVRLVDEGGHDVVDLDAQTGRITAGKHKKNGHLYLYDASDKLRIDADAHDGKVKMDRVQIAQTNPAEGRVLMCTDGAGNAEWRPYDGVPVGAVMAFGGRTAPDGWEVCDGRMVSGNDSKYKRLYEFFDTQVVDDWDAWKWRGNGIRPSFNIPNLQGDFIRAAYGGTGVWDWKSDRLRTHGHTFTGTKTATTREKPKPSTSWEGTLHSWWSSGIIDPKFSNTLIYTNEDDHRHWHTPSGTVGNPNVDHGSETYPRNTSLLVCIKL